MSEPRSRPAWRALEKHYEDALDSSDGNQRVLLHCARSRVPAALERHLDVA